MASLMTTGKLGPNAFFSITTRAKDSHVAELDVEGIVRFHTSASHDAAVEWIQRTYMEILMQENDTSYEDELANNYFGENR